MIRWVVRGAVVIAAACLVGLRLTEPDFDLQAAPLSAYALTGSTRIWQLAMLASGIAVMAAALLERDRLMRLPLVGSAVGLLGVAAVPTDPWFPWERMPTVPGAIHVLFAGLAMGAFGLATLRDLTGHAWPSRWGFFGRSGQRPGWPGPVSALANRLLGGAYVGLLALTLAATGGTILVGSSPRFIGAAERVLIAIALGWCLVRSVAVSPALHGTWRKGGPAAGGGASGRN